MRGTSIVLKSGKSTRKDPKERTEKRMWAEIKVQKDLRKKDLEAFKKLAGDPSVVLNVNFF